MTRWVIVMTPIQYRSSFMKFFLVLLVTLISLKAFCLELIVVEKEDFRTAQSYNVVSDMEVFRIPNSRSARIELAHGLTSKGKKLETIKLIMPTDSCSKPIIYPYMQFSKLFFLQAPTKRHATVDMACIRYEVTYILNQSQVEEAVSGYQHAGIEIPGSAQNQLPFAGQNKIGNTRINANDFDDYLLEIEKEDEDQYSTGRILSATLYKNNEEGIFKTIMTIR